MAYERGERAGCSQLSAKTRARRAVCPVSCETGSVMTPRPDGQDRGLERFTLGCSQAVPLSSCRT